MNANQMRPRPMTEIQLEYAKKRNSPDIFFRNYEFVGELIMVSD